MVVGELQVRLPGGFPQPGPRPARLRPSRKGERKGRRLGFPRFKKRGKCRDSFRLTGAIRCDRGTVTLPRLGTIRTHEPPLRLARKIEDGAARILSATVSRTAQRWFVAFTVEAEREVPVARITLSMK